MSKLPIIKSKKYKLKSKVTSIGQLVKVLDKDGLIFLRHKVYAKGWVISMRLVTLLDYINKGWVYQVKKK